MTLTRVVATAQTVCVMQLMLLPTFIPFMIKNNPASKVGIIEPVIKELKEKHGAGRSCSNVEKVYGNQRVYVCRFSEATYCRHTEGGRRRILLWS